MWRRATCEIVICGDSTGEICTLSTQDVFAIKVLVISTVTSCWRNSPIEERTVRTVFKRQELGTRQENGWRVLGSIVWFLCSGATPSLWQKAADRSVTDRTTNKLPTHRTCRIFRHRDWSGCITGSTGRKGQWYCQYTGSPHSERQICSRNEATINQDINCGMPGWIHPWIHPGSRDESIQDPG